MILSILILCIFFIFTTIVLVLLHHFFRVKKQSVSNNDLVYDDDLDVIAKSEDPELCLEASKSFKDVDVSKCAKVVLKKGAYFNKS